MLSHKYTYLHKSIENVYLMDWGWIMGKYLTVVITRWGCRWFNYVHWVLLVHDCRWKTKAKSADLAFSNDVAALDFKLFFL